MAASSRSSSWTARRERGRRRGGGRAPARGVALAHEPSDAGELHQEAPPLPRVVLARLAVVLALVAHQVAQADLARAQQIAETEHPADRMRGTERLAQHGELALLDALGDRDLALARQQRHRAHLAEVDAHRVRRAGDVVGNGAHRGGPLVRLDERLRVRLRLDLARRDRLVGGLLLQRDEAAVESFGVQHRRERHGGDGLRLLGSRDRVHGHTPMSEPFPWKPIRCAAAASGVGSR
jgi:hypothetical protein